MSSKGPDAPGKNGQQGGRPKNGSPQEGEEAPGQAPIVSPSPTQSNDAQKSEDKTVPWWKRTNWKVALEVVGIFFAIGYAIVTYLQWRDSNRNFLIEERAWLTISTIHTPEFKDGRALQQVAQVLIANTGKTPARNATIDCAMRIMQSAEPADLRYPEPHQNIFSAIIIPNGSFTLDVPKAGTIDSTQPIPISDREVDDLISGRRYLITYCRGTFNDFFGKPHWVKTCTPTIYFHGGSTYTYRNCIASNDTGDGDLPKD